MIKPKSISKSINLEKRSINLPTEPNFLSTELEEKLREKLKTLYIHINTISNPSPDHSDEADKEPLEHDFTNFK